MLKHFARVLLEPIAKILRRFFDPRFTKLEQEHAGAYAKLNAVADAMWTDSHIASVRDEAMRDAITLTNTRVSRIESTLTAQQAQLLDTLNYLQDAQTKLDAYQSHLATQTAHFDSQQKYAEDQQIKSDRAQKSLGELHLLLENLPRILHKADQIKDISPIDADLLNHAESHLGFRSQAGLWFNPPDVVQYRQGDVTLSGITERSIEIPFTLAAITSRKSAGSSILDVGCSESLVPLEFASLGYAVTGIDLRPYPLRHPNLTTFATPLQDWETTETFDAVVCLSSIEHFGLGTYGEATVDNRLDHQAMQILLERIKADGLLIMTIPYGETDVTPVQRMYDRSDLDTLLEGWTIDTIDIAIPTDGGWVIADGIPDPAPTADPPITRQVALITAHPDV